ncbi:MAG TPA: YceH family protein [Steroidobacteraceae bacterium]|nr:YceH family protein [Steroidobacteraceae bacterium]
MNIVLSEVEARVLGALVEKEITTPDYYPLSLNALVNACNQKSNREPVLELDEDAVREALDGLNAHGLAGARSGAESRVTKYEHRLPEVFNLSRGETAVLCVLLLRGPQTPGELRSRASRMAGFADVGALEAVLQRLAERTDGPFVAALPREPGRRESRFMHLFGGEPPPAHSTAPPDDLATRLEAIEQELRTLRAELDALKSRSA